MSVVLADCFRIVTDEFLDYRRADTGVLHQTRGGMAKTVKGEVILAPPPIAAEAIGFLLVRARGDQAGGGHETVELV